MNFGFRSSLCESCAHKQEVVSGTGSRFLLCQASRTDPKYSRYPHQPVVQCEGYVVEGESKSGECRPEDGAARGR